MLEAGGFCRGGAVSIAVTPTFFMAIPNPTCRGRTRAQITLHLTAAYPRATRLFTHAMAIEPGRKDPSAIGGAHRYRHG